MRGNTADLVRACIGHRPVVLGLVDREGGLRRACGSVRVRHCQTKEDIGFNMLTKWLPAHWNWDVCNTRETNPEGPLSPERVVSRHEAGEGEDGGVGRDLLLPQRAFHLFPVPGHHLVIVGAL